jgi:hypothetical protein
MRKLFACFVPALLVAALSAGPAAATHNSGVGPGYDFVTGTGSVFVVVPPFGPFDVQLHVNARSSANGDNPRGSFWTTLEGALTVNLRGHVTCMQVQDHNVSLSGRIDESSIGFPPVGSGIFAFGVDAGEGSKSSGDGVLGIPIGQPLQNCPDPVSDGVLVRQGNFVAHDAVPLP